MDISNVPLNSLLGQRGFSREALRIRMESSMTRELPHIPEQRPTLLHPSDLNHKSQSCFKPTAIFPLHKQRISYFPDHPLSGSKPLSAKMSSEEALISLYFYCLYFRWPEPCCWQHSGFCSTVLLLTSEQRGTHWEVLAITFIGAA